MKQFFNLFILFVFISGLALAQEGLGDSKETLHEQATALAELQSITPSSIKSVSYNLPEVTHPLFVAVDDVNIPTYVGNPATNEWLQAFIGAYAWGAAYDPVNDKVYFNAGSVLWEWAVGGVITELGPMTDTGGNTINFVGLAFYDGTLYGTRNITNEAVYLINTTTLVATVYIDYADPSYDFGGFSADPNTGELYGLSDTSPNGLYRINNDGTATFIVSYPAGQTDIDGLAISDDGFAYMVTDEQDSVYVYDLIGGTYAAALYTPWTSSETFSAGAWIFEAGGSSYGLPEILYYLFDEAGSTTTQNFAVPGSGSQFADVLGGLTMGPTGQFDNALIGAGGSGSTDYVNTGWATDIGASSWTISLWLNNLLDNSTLRYLFGDNTATSFRCFYNGVAPTGGIILRGGGLTDVGVSGVKPGPSVVHFVYDATIPDVKAYVNGVLSVTVPQPAVNISGTGPFKVGGYSTSAGMEAGGLLDEFRFYSRALDAAEIAATWDISIIPVELTSFSASVSGNSVQLLWETATETNNSGFNIERKSANSEYVEVGFVPGFGTTTEPKSYSFEDNNLRMGTYTYRLKQIDFDGTFEYSDEVEVDVVAPAQYSLDQNYPNPFNPSTKITFSLAANSKVSLKVFDVLGQEVASLVNQDLTAGIHNYDFNAAGFNSGVYFYRIEAIGTDGAEFVDVKKMILVK